jgi:hypothetical protein
MKISGIAIGQWNANCKNQEGQHRTKYKIHRAIVFGNVSHVYQSKDYVIRYYDMNILISHTGIVMMVWRDQSRPVCFFDESDKVHYDSVTSNKQNISNANKKHGTIVRNIKYPQVVVDTQEDVEDSFNDVDMAI